MQRQAAREGGQFLILSPNDGSAADLSALPGGLFSTDKDTDISETPQSLNEKVAAAETESVARNYTDIREGGIIANNQTYLLELVDEHNNTLFIQLSKNGEYWTINSAGIFRKKYSRNKREIYNRPALSPDTNTDTSGVDSGRTDGVTTPAGNSPQTSTDKDTDISEAPQSLNEKVAAAKTETDTNPSEKQKKAGRMLLMLMNNGLLTLWTIREILNFWSM